MSEFEPNQKAIKRRRLLTEARLSELIEEAQIVLAIDDIKALIYHYPDKRFDAYIRQLSAIFGAADNPITIDSLLPVIQDAWNYFPHGALNGRSPAEALEELV